MELLNFMKRLLSENLGLKVTALALALLMWLTLSSEPPVEKAIGIPLEYRNIPPGLEFSSPPVWNIDVQVRIPGRSQTVTERDFTAFVDLKSVGEGEKVIYLTQDNVRSPFRVDVLKITPSRITLVLERTTERMVPIDPTIDGLPAPNYEVIDATVFPSTITISGPHSRVERITRARTETVSVAGKNSDVIALANVIVDDTNVRQDTRPIQVKVKIQEKRKEVSVEGVPVDVVPSNARVRLQPAKLDVQVSVPASFERAIDPQVFHAAVDLTESPIAGTRKVVPFLEIKKGIQLDMKIVSFFPSEVKVSPVGRRRKRHK
jgi:YbbR domain-containing protein